MPPAARISPVATFPPDLARTIVHDEAAQPPDTLEPVTASPYVTRDEVAAILDDRLRPLHALSERIMTAVGHEAQKHRARREAGLLAAAVAAVGCLGLGALSLQGASDAVVAMLTAIVLTTVVGVIAVVGRVQLVAKAPGVSVDAHAEGSMP